MKETQPQLDTILIRNLLVRCIIGIHDDERRDKQDIIINVTLYSDLRMAGQTDNLTDSIDYAMIEKDILALVEDSRFSLVGKLAEEIARVCLDNPKVQKVRVTADKPGAFRFASSAAVEIVRTKSNGKP